MDKQPKKLAPHIKELLQKSAHTIRQLSIEAIEKAKSGHPGLPMGCAELGAYLFACVLRYDPRDPQWLGRDRFILSAGHGSMLLYSCLHLAGFDLSLDDLKEFRQLHSKTPGHPEYGHTPGVETTTGPLGQGVAHAVGQAMGLKVLKSKFENEEFALFDSKVYVLASDGDIMEGVSGEASSLAGHLCLDNLVVLYDSNQICLDGPLSETYSEEIKLRYRAYGWDVHEIDGHDLEAIDAAFQEINVLQKRPILMIAKTTIGKGSPQKEGSHTIHGAPLGQDELQATKKALGLPDESFYVPQGVREFFEMRGQKLKDHHEKWQASFEDWKEKNPEDFSLFQKMLKKTLEDEVIERVCSLDIPSPIAGRAASSIVLNELAASLPHVIGGSADLSSSDKAFIKGASFLSSQNFSGRNIKYGTREFAMGGISCGLAQTGLLTPFCGTFLVFSDYLRGAIRMAALMKLRVIYQFTHDSIFLGEDGPTHQPVEHLASLRAIVNLQVIRPADAQEVKGAWLVALQYQGPTAIILSRQSLFDVAGTELSYSEGVAKGAYIVKKEVDTSPHVTLFATGSELHLALHVADELIRIGKRVRVISMPCWEVFERQDSSYKESVVGGDLGKRVSIEAACDLGWHKYIGLDGISICMESYGASAPSGVLAEEFGFVMEDIVEQILSEIS